jgi:type IV pilus assembly protein PilA
MKNNRKGFTLAELLIVVAIIAVLVAVAIPVFTSQLEKSREATDAANIRSAYAVIQSAALIQDDATTIAKNNNSTTTFTTSGNEGSFVYQAVVKMKQTQNDWQSGAQDIGGIAVAATGTVLGNGTCTVKYEQSTNKTTLTWGSGSTGG